MTLDLSSSIIKHFYKFYFFPVFPFLSSQAFQLPRQDLALAYCRYVEPQNHTSYQDFVAARNGIIIHRGKKKKDLIWVRFPGWTVSVSECISVLLP
jgi:hypothetical protein